MLGNPVSHLYLFLVISVLGVELLPGLRHGPVRGVDHVHVAAVTPASPQPALLRDLNTNNTLVLTTFWLLFACSHQSRLFFI